MPKPRKQSWTAKGDPHLAGTSSGFAIHYYDPTFCEPPWPGQRLIVLNTIASARDQAVNDLALGLADVLGIWRMADSRAMDQSQRERLRSGEFPGADAPAGNIANAQGVAGYGGPAEDDRVDIYHWAQDRDWVMSLNDADAAMTRDELDQHVEEFRTRQLEASARTPRNDERGGIEDALAAQGIDSTPELVDAIMRAARLA